MASILLLAAFESVRLTRSTDRNNCPFQFAGNETRKRRTQSDMRGLGVEIVVLPQTGFHQGNSRPLRRRRTDAGATHHLGSSGLVLHRRRQN